MIIGGGGNAGSTLGKFLAAENVMVLIIEIEKQFHDRVRGEGIWPWGVLEAQKLGILDLLRETCGHEVRWFTRNGLRTATRNDFIETTPNGLGELDFYHPEMQEVLIQAAEQASADVWQGRWRPAPSK